MDRSTLSDLQLLQFEIRNELEARYGPLLGGKTLVSALGMANSAALRQARRRGHVAVVLFTVPNRRGCFALTRDVADWLAQVRLSAPSNVDKKKGGISTDRV